jgi:hypothetical protein
MVPTRAADQSSSIVSAISGVSREPWKSGGGQDRLPSQGQERATRDGSHRPMSFSVHDGQPRVSW